MNKRIFIRLLFLATFLYSCDPAYTVSIYNKTNDTAYFSVGQKKDTLPGANKNILATRTITNDPYLKEPGYFILPKEKLLLYTGNISYGPQPLANIKYIKIHSKQVSTTISDKDELSKMLETRKSVHGNMVNTDLYFPINK